MFYSKISAFMIEELQILKDKIYNPLSLEISEFMIEEEGQIYKACKFKLNIFNIVFRQSKITPKKQGQFVTFWTRDLEGKTQPFDKEDHFDFFVINVKNKNHFGQFLIPKSELIKRGIISTSIKKGKRGFRVYPPWDKPTNKQAQQTQIWQLRYFVELDPQPNIKLLRQLLLS